MFECAAATPTITLTDALHVFMNTIPAHDPVTGLTQGPLVGISPHFSSLSSTLFFLPIQECAFFHFSIAPCCICHEIFPFSEVKMKEAAAFGHRSSHPHQALASPSPVVYLSSHSFPFSSIL